MPPPYRYRALVSSLKDSASACSRRRVRVSRNESTHPSREPLFLQKLICVPRFWLLPITRPRRARLSPPPPPFAATIILCRVISPRRDRSPPRAADLFLVELRRHQRAELGRALGGGLHGVHQRAA